MVGAAGFEPTTPSPPVKCATRLRYAPTCGGYTRRRGTAQFPFLGAKHEQIKAGNVVQTSRRVKIATICMTMVFDAKLENMHAIPSHGIRKS